MARKALSREWLLHMQAQLDTHANIDVTSGFLPAIQHIVKGLSIRGCPYALYNLGAGVRRITTDTQTCPCCRRPLEREPVAPEREEA